MDKDNLTTCDIQVYNGNLHELERLPESLLSSIRLRSEKESIELSLKKKTFGFNMQLDSYILENINLLLNDSLRIHIDYILMDGDNIIKHIVRFKNCRLNDMTKVNNLILTFKLEFSYELMEDSSRQYM